ncbi:hypothetical protein FA95DRAFT_305611 [Auriscalpium vulgare]|uniref:Uncharacterized protein n=1 Tax=Auriscalpium vulgare TaxID=40419 RepID=A0ACB8RK34_9AGAM|nr:hypothetical protein FA95DRAFT_305611 [Auriscalpium vulgare]
MDTQKMHNFGEGSPTSTTEAWLSTFRLQLSHVDSGSPEMLPALFNERAATNSLLSIVDAQINACAPVSRLPSELVVTIQWTPVASCRWRRSCRCCMRPATWEPLVPDVVCHHGTWDIRPRISRHTGVSSWTI